MSLTSGQLLLQANFNTADPLGGTLGSVNIPTDFNGSSSGLVIALTPGAGSYQYQNLYAGGQSVVSGTPLLLNLTNGSLKMPDGSATNFADIGLLLVRNNGTANLTMGGGSNAVTSILGATGTITIPPGAIIPLINLANSAYWTVTNSTANILQFVAASGTVPFDLILAGH
jgi:hypothetical protein